MIKRTLQQYLLRDARLYPVLTLTGPRQAGKTTFCYRHITATSASG